VFFRSGTAHDQDAAGRWPVVFPILYPSKYIEQISVVRVAVELSQAAKAQPGGGTCRDGIRWRGEGER